MLYFADIQYLWLLLLVPVFPVAYAVFRKMRRRRVEKLGDRELVERLMPSRSRSRGWWQVVLFSIGFAFFAVGLSRPLIGAKLKEHETRGAEVVIALDVSNSMLAQDYSPNRLERAKLAIARIVDKLRDDRIGLVVFAGGAYVQLPVTTDYVSAKMFLNAISTESVPVQGTALGEAINTSARSFSAQSEKSRAIIVITDGENHEDDPVGAAKDAAEMGIRVFAIGVGSPEGKPIPLKDGGLLKDRNGEIVVTRLDEDILKQVAEVGGGAYVRAGNSEFGLNPIIDEIRRMESEKFNSIVFEEYDEQYMYFFAIALLFFVVEGLIGSRKSRFRLFGK
ncbi:MAG: VWA domain-containing protein [Candidatus Cryptobacteroides sp.]